MFKNRFGILATTCVYVVLAVTANPTHGFSASNRVINIDAKQPPEFAASAKYQEESYINSKSSSELAKIFGTESMRPGYGLMPGEFYTFMRVENNFHDPAVVKRCVSSNKIWFLASTVLIDYKRQNGFSIVNFVPKSSVLVDGNNYKKTRAPKGMDAHSSLSEIRLVLIFCTSAMTMTKNNTYSTSL